MEKSNDSNLHVRWEILNFTGEVKLFIVLFAGIGAARNVFCLQDCCGLPLQRKAQAEKEISYCKNSFKILYCITE